MRLSIPNKKVVIVYDDTVVVDSRNKSILGKKSFGDMIVRRKKLASRTEEIFKKAQINEDFKIIRTIKDFSDIEKFAQDCIFFHLFSSSAIIDPEDFEIFAEKLPFVKEKTFLKRDDKIFGAVFCERNSYLDSLKEFLNTGAFKLGGNIIETNTFVDLTDYNNLLTYISSGFDARYFNTLQGNEYTITKRSSDKRKMKAEYSYYWLLPEEMKNWVVMPFNYKESSEGAEYTMERMPMTDIAIRWTHGAIDENEFKKILDKTFYFLQNRTKKRVSKESFEKLTNELYLKKVDSRIKNFKNLPQYSSIASLVESGTDFGSIDEIVALYKKLYKKVSANAAQKKEYYCVIGHGDVFFANMLYSKEVNLLRLIDPKGALTEDELWTNPFYDIAKLSHSICGNYDFFNCDTYDIELSSNMRFDLKIHFDNKNYVDIFKKYLKDNGIDYYLIRLYESSLFLSMLPLHIDNPRKVFGFILNAINILREVEENV